MGCVIYYLYGEAIPALMAEAKPKGGGAAQALNEVLIDGNENFKSFYPLLWLADKKWYYRDNNANFGRIDWIARYNNLVDRMREKMRRELGVVEYVEADE